MGPQKYPRQTDINHNNIGNSIQPISFCSNNIVIALLHKILISDVPHQHFVESTRDDRVARRHPVAFLAIPSPLDQFIVHKCRSYFLEQQLHQQVHSKDEPENKQQQYYLSLFLLGFRVKYENKVNEEYGKGVKFADRFVEEIIGDPVLLESVGQSYAQFLKLNLIFNMY